MKKENTALKEELARLRKGKQIDVQGADEGDGRNLKRWRENSAGVMLNGAANTSVDATSRKRFRSDTDSPVPSSTGAPMGNYTQHTMVYMPSPPSLASSPDSNGIPARSFSPLSFVPISAPGASASASALYAMSSQQTSTPTSAVYPSDVQRLGPKPFDSLGSSPTFDSFDCGLCSDNSPCVCREFAMQQAMAATVMGGAMSEYSQTYQSQLAQVHGQGVLKVEDVEFERNLSPNVIEIPPAPESVQTPSRSSVTKSPSPAAPIANTSSSILDNLPAYQPAIPLRRNSTVRNETDNTHYQIRLTSPEPDSNTASSARPTAVPLSLPRRKTTGTVWQTVAATASLSGSTTPMCSGDPSNCPACKDDDFGKAFCKALGDSACSTSPCATCPNPEACSSKKRHSSQPSSSADSNGVQMIQLTPARPDIQRSISSTATLSTSVSSHGSSSFEAAQSGKIPANEAWATLKSHPGIAFADLSMLADVVARRTKCSGPVAVIYPPPGAATPEREAARSPAIPDPKASTSSSSVWTGRPNRKDDSPILLTDPHAHYKVQEQHRALFGPPTPTGTTSNSSGPQGDSRPPVLVPQEELRECGRRHIREVDAAGVRDALRILDAQFGRR